MILEKFLPLEKMEEQSDGTLHVYGIVTAESPDLDKEVCDYDGTKPFYQARAEDQMKKTSLPGMTPSVMPFREMHALKVQGAGRTMDFDDAAKTIRMSFHIVNPDAVKMWKAGCFVGFSQGGRYVKQWPDPVYKDCQRYIADPSEVSAVDSPCLPVALVESMKGRTVTLTKAAGGTEVVPLQVLTLDKAVTAHLERLEKQMAELKSAEQSERQKQVEAGRALTDTEKEAITRTAATLTLSKSLYDVGWLGQLICDLHWMCLQSEWERDEEGDDSKVPDELRASWHALLASFKEMAIEEADELAALAGKAANMKITDQAGLTKAAKTIHEHLAKCMEVHKAFGDHLKKAHETIESKHAAVGEHIEKCMKAAKDASEGEEPEKAGVPETNKALEDKVEALTKSLADLTEKLAKSPAAIPPATGASGSDGRGEDPASDLFKSKLGPVALQ